MFPPGQNPGGHYYHLLSLFLSEFIEVFHVCNVRSITRIVLFHPSRDAHTGWIIPTEHTPLSFLQRLHDQETYVSYLEFSSNLTIIHNPTHLWSQPSCWLIRYLRDQNSHSHSVRERMSLFLPIKGLKSPVSLSTVNTPSSKMPCCTLLQSFSKISIPLSVRI